MVLILLGDGVVAGVLLNRSKAQNGGWIVITAGWAIAVMAGVFTSRRFGGPGFINPVGPLAGLVLGDVPSSDVLPLVAGEFLGALTGAVLVWLHYLPHWSETSDRGLKLAVFCTSPAIRRPPMNMLSEAIATFLLVFVSAAFVEKEVGRPFIAPLAGALVWGIGLSLGGRPDTRSIRPATSPHALRMPCCRFPGKAAPTGRTLGFRSSDRSSGPWPPRCSCGRSTPRR